MINRKLQFRIFLGLFAFFAFGYTLQNFDLLQKAATSFLAIIGALLYIVSQLVRAIRLRFMIASADFKTKDAIFTQFGSVSLGNFLVPFAKDLLACYLFFLANKEEISKIIISLLYIRFFDFLVISPLLFVWVLSGSAESQGIAFAVVAFMLGIFVLLLMLPSLSKLLIDFLIKYSHNSQSLFLIKFISGFQKVYSEMHLNKIDKIFIIFLFTIASWSIELCAVHLVSFLFNNVSWGNSYYSVIANVLTNIPFVATYNHNPAIYTVPYVVLILVSLVFLFIYGNDIKGKSS